MPTTQLANFDPSEAVEVYISSDGTHYGYQIFKSNGSIEIYADGTLMGRDRTGLQLFAVTNVGDPVYSTPAQGQLALYRGGNKLTSAPRGFVVVRISGDGSHWLAYQRGDLGGLGSLVMDGTVLLPSTATFPQDQFVLLSENGKHWSCYLQEVGSGKLLIGGVTRSTSPALQSPQITSSGHVAWVDNVDGSAHVDDRVSTFSSPASGVFINDDASHLLVMLRDGHGRHRPRSTERETLGNTVAPQAAPLSEERIGDSTAFRWGPHQSWCTAALVL